MPGPSSEHHHPAHHQDAERSSFQNPWPPVKSLTSALLSVLRLPVTRSTPLPQGIQEITTVRPDFGLYERNKQDLCATWLGHAGFMVQLPLCGSKKPALILFDPIFSERASPSSWFGPRRRLSAPCTPEELPTPDFVVISHNHYDHLDLVTIERVWKNAQPTTIRFLVPLGVKASLTSIDIPECFIHELDWWDILSFPASTQSKSVKVEFVCTPAQHNSGRGVLDQGRTLWSSWVVRQTSDDPNGQGASIYHGGDTGYQTADGPCPVFKEIGDKYGPFDLAMIPIWRGASLSFLGKLDLRLDDDTLLSTLHALPEDAVHLAADIRARHTLAMHFATFAGSADEALEPLVRLEKATGGRGWREEGGFGAMDVGETVVIPRS